MQRLHFTTGLSTDLDGGVLLETNSQDPPNEGEAEEPWGIFVCVLKITLAAAAKGAVHSVETAPPEADDAICQAGAAQAVGAPREAAPAGAAPAGAAPAGAAPAGAAPAETTPAGGPAVYEEAAPA